MSPKNPWKLVTSKIVYQNRWITVHEDAVITPTGSDGIYGYMSSNDSVIVVVLNDKNEVYFVKRFAYPLKRWIWGLPGGGGDQEDAVTASQRELEEETGILAKTWDKLGKTSVCNGLMTEYMSTYLARDLSFSGEQEHSDEKINEARFFSRDEIETMIVDGELYDGQALAALHLLSIWEARH